MLSDEKEFRVVPRRSRPVNVIFVAGVLPHESKFRDELANQLKKDPLYLLGDGDEGDEELIEHSATGTARIRGTRLSVSFLLSCYYHKRADFDDVLAMDGLNRDPDKVLRACFRYFKKYPDVISDVS